MKKMMIRIRINEILKRRGRTAYWLAKKTGVSYTTLWRLGKGHALGVNFATLEKICGALDCDPGDLITLTAEKEVRPGKVGNSEN